MTVSLPQKSLSPQFYAESIFPYLDGEDGLAFVSTTMFYGYFEAIKELARNKNYDHPLLLRAVTHIALDHPRYQAYRDLEEKSRVPAKDTDLKICNIVGYYLVNGDFLFNPNRNLGTPTQLTQIFQQAYKSKKDSLFSRGRDRDIMRRQEFHREMPSEFIILRKLLLNDDRFLLQSLGRNHSILDKYPTTWILKRLKNTTNRDFVLAVVKINVKSFQHVTKTFADDKNIVLEAVKQDGNTLRHASPRLKNDREVVLEAVKQDSKALEYVSSELKDDQEIVLEAVKQFGYALEYVSPRLKDDRGVVLAAVKEDSNALAFASPRLKDDREIVLVAVRQSSRALSYASPRLKDDREVVSVAVRQSSWALSYASDALQKDPGMLLIHNESKKASDRMQSASTCVKYQSDLSRQESIKVLGPKQRASTRVEHRPDNGSGFMDFFEPLTISECLGALSRSNLQS